LGSSIGVGEFFDVTVAGSIKSVEFSQETPCCGDGVLFDDFSFTAPAVIPVPATMPLLVAGLGGFGFLARRRRQA